MVLEVHLLEVVVFGGDGFFELFFEHFLVLNEELVFPEDLIVLFFINFDIMVLGLERLVVLREYFLVILKFHKQGFALLIFLMQFFIGEFLFIQLPLDALEFAEEVFEIMLVESAFVLQLLLEVVGFLGEGGLELLDCAALLL
jgi:hypothetical protein